ncbi:S-adenosyl-L-methionine-dependent tRNA 4-demethylwyosine synthase [Elysia marginata]|uniref:S-adenosyl-L-methionine-dependent tRNA 4-demethylwyosine synthase n=1 Tax=Elysia marginata TaxID=1093978 RepID=A0AAV4GKF6_9GAST|nr:S-adenosyl-L-methionine-dependent tRNA 4-demethylwyosine synthase [Elysia marginata]
MGLSALFHFLLLSSLVFPAAPAISPQLLGAISFQPAGFLSLYRYMSDSTEKYGLLISSPETSVGPSGATTSTSRVAVVTDIGSKLNNLAGVTPDIVNTDVIWPNVVSKVPDEVLGGADQYIVIPNGFVDPDRRSGALVMQPLKGGDASVITPTTSEWFYNKVQWVDMNKDGTLDALTCRARRSQSSGLQSGINDPYGQYMPAYYNPPQQYGSPQQFGYLGQNGPVGQYDPSGQYNDPSGQYNDPSGQSGMPPPSDPLGVLGPYPPPNMYAPSQQISLDSVSRFGTFEGELVWYSNPQDHSLDSLWAENFVNPGPDVFFTHTKFDVGGSEKEVIITAEYFRSQFRVFWTESPNQDWSNPSLVRSRDIDRAVGTPALPGLPFGVEVHDVNKDGKDDIVLSLNDPANGGIYVYEVPDDFRTGTFTRHVIANGFSEIKALHTAGSPALFAFLPSQDSSQKPSIVVAGGDSCDLTILEPVNPTDPRDWTYWKKEILQTALSSVEGVQVADVDGDGRYEIFATAYEFGAVYVWTV